MFTISFYIFSLFLSYTDFTRFIVPNVLLGTMSFMLLIFGFLEKKIYISSVILVLIVLLFFIVIMLLNKEMILGGGDIKYMMAVALYLGVSSFALFLIITGILQTLSLLYVQKVRKRRVAPMVPMMFLATVIVEISVGLNWYVLKI